MLIRRHVLVACVLAQTACVGQIPGNAQDQPPAPGDAQAPGAAQTPAATTPAAAPPSAQAPAANASILPRGFGAPRIWKLTATQYAATTRALLGAAGDVGDALAGAPGSGTEFSNGSDGLQMSPPQVEQLWSLAADLASRAARSPGALAACLAARLDDRACVASFVSDFVGRAFRRPLAPAERDAYLAFWDREVAARGAAAALEQLLRGVFMSPHFLYRTELGAEGAAGARVALTVPERAAALSYFLSDGPPDAELSRAANEGRLATAADLEAQARRLLSAPPTAQGLLRFFTEHLRADAIKTLTKDAKAFPTFTPQLADEMARETSRFIENVLWSGDGRLGTLFTAQFSTVSKGLATLYGATAPPMDFARVALPAGQRTGLLTQASFLAREASATDSDAVKRGLFLRKTFLCSPPPPPPPNVNAVPPPPDGATTQRERLGRHDQDPTCAGCHSLIDPLGLPLEMYDAVGRYRTKDAGKPIDARGAIVGTPASDGPVADTVELGARLAASPDARACLARKLFRYAQGRTERDDDAGWLQDFTRAFDQSGGDVRALAVALTTSDSFTTRAAGRTP